MISEAVLSTPNAVMVGSLADAGIAAMSRAWRRAF